MVFKYKEEATNEDRPLKNKLIIRFNKCNPGKIHASFRSATEYDRHAKQ